MGECCYKDRQWVRESFPALSTSILTPCWTPRGLAFPHPCPGPCPSPLPLPSQGQQEAHILSLLQAHRNVVTLREVSTNVFRNHDKEAIGVTCAIITAPRRRLQDTAN